MTLGQQIVASKDLAEALSYWATAVGIALTLVVGFAAVIKYFLDSRNDHWRRADELYCDFLNDALAYPQFFGGNWKQKTSQDPELRNQYTYFVGKFLWAFEQIISSKAYDYEWRDDLKIILMEHVDYLSSDFFQLERPGYPKELLTLIDEVVFVAQTKTMSINHA